MDVLLVESHPGLGCQARRELEAAGHSVVSCFGDDLRTPCGGLVDEGDCPLDTHEVEVAVVARLGPELHAGEHGALCAARHRIPIVGTGDTVDPGALAPVLIPVEGDLAGAVERAAESGSRHAAAVVRQLLSDGVLGRDDLVHDGSARVAIDVRRARRRLVMTVWLRDGDQREASIVRAAIEALRAYDPNAAVIDVRVRHHSMDSTCCSVSPEDIDISQNL